MSKAYRIHGARFLRKYSAADRSSIYAYMSDVKLIANTLCKVPWTRVANDIAATTTIHTEEGLDWNEPERDRFDAAEWCGEHSNGFHRAFAQAACYVFKLPTSAIGKSIQKLGIQVTSDAYNPYGARIAAMTSATLNIPMACDTVREGEVFRAPDEDGMGAAPRLYLRNKDGSQQWYSNTELVELTPETPLTAKQYLFVFVCLENYNRGRDGWIEGSSYIDNDVELTLGTACEDLVEDELNDLSSVTDPVELKIIENGIVPDVVGENGSVVGVVVTAGGSVPILDENMRLVDVQSVRDESDPVNSISGVRGVYARLGVGGAVSYQKAFTNPNSRRCGVGFSVVQGRGIAMVAQDGEILNPRVVSLTAASLVVPFSVPDGFRPQKLKFDFSAWKSGRTPTSGSVFNVWAKDGAYVDAYDPSVLKKVEIYDASVSEVDGWSLVGRVDACGVGLKYLQLPAMSGRVGSLLVTAYIPQGSIPTTDDAFSRGTGEIWFNPCSPDSVIGFSPEVYPDRDPNVRYRKGDRLAIEAPVSRFVPNDVVNSASFVANDDSSIAVVIKTDDSTVYVTNDLKTLKTTNLPSGEYHVVYQGMFFASDEGGVIYASSDGQHWSVTNLPPISGFGSNKNILRIGNLFFITNLTYCSLDGLVWTQTDIIGNVNARYAYNNGVYVAIAGNNIVRSTNGVNWSVISSFGSGRVKICNGVFFILGISQSVMSIDGNSFTTLNVNITNIEYSDGYYFGIKDQNDADTGLYYSIDGINFNKTNVVGWVNMKILGGLLFVWTTDSLTDGSLWMRDSFPDKFKMVANFNNVTVNMYAVGHSFLYYADGRLLRSIDGESWDEVSIIGDVVLLRVYNGLAYAIVDDDDVKKCLVSGDGKSWSEVDVDFSTFDRVTYEGGLVFAERYEDNYRMVGVSTGMLPCVCVSSETDVGDVAWPDFKIEDNPIKDRMHGFSELCVPDITLIG